MVKRLYFLIPSLILALFPTTALSKTFIPNGPLFSRTQNPIYLETLGQMPTRAVALGKGQFSGWLNMSYSNMFELGRHNDNEVFLDMELARLAFDFAWGVGEDMELDLEIPFLHFNGGYFDAFIQGFHKAFGFPNGGRNQFPNGAFKYHLIKDGALRYNVRRLPIGLSDIIVGFKHHFLSEGRYNPGVAWTFRFKFPTGRRDSGLGSGNIDYSLGVAAEKSIARFHFYLNLDYIVATGNARFGELYNNEMLAWLAAAELSVSQPVSILVQLQGSTPLLTGLGTNKWDGFPLDLIMGVKGTHKKLVWGNDFFWQWSFSEDLASEGPSVDITTMLVVGVNFGRILGGAD